MKNMKIILHLLIALLSFSLFLLGCSSENGGGDEPNSETTLTETNEEIAIAETSTEIPPSSTPVPPTETPFPPTETPLPPTTTPTPTVDPFAGFQQFNSDAAGINLLYPEGWVFEEETDSLGEGIEVTSLFFASTEGLLDIWNVDTQGAYFSVQTLEWLASFIGDPQFDDLISADLDLTDPISILNEELLTRSLMQEHQSPRNEVVLEGEPTAIIINGYEAASVAAISVQGATVVEGNPTDEGYDATVEAARAQKEVRYSGTMYAIVDSGRAIVILSWLSDGSDFQPALDTILSSVQLNP